MIAVEADDAVFYRRHPESEFLSVFILSSDMAAHLDDIAGRQFVQWYLVKQFNVAFPKGVSG